MDHLLTFEDLQKLGIVRNHTILRRLINRHDFPKGDEACDGLHRWIAAEVFAWLDTHERK